MNRSNLYNYIIDAHLIVCIIYVNIMCSTTQPIGGYFTIIILL